MGVMYYLAREDNRTLFEIGKLSAISDLFREFGYGRAREQEWLPREVPPEADLRELIRVAIDDLDFSVDRDLYAAELARRIVAFANDQPVCLLNDASSHDEIHDHYSDDNDSLCVVDSVYTAEWGDWATGRTLKHAYPVNTQGATMSDVSTPEECDARNQTLWATLPGDLERLAEQCCDEFHGEIGTFQDFADDRQRWREFAKFLWGLGARPQSERGR